MRYRVIAIRTWHRVGRTGALVQGLARDDLALQVLPEMELVQLAGL